jgi:vitamin B12/bleomycin/antimicrobial peptide transport system ATP-binding/permease protein
VSRDVMNSLQAKDSARFHHLLMLFAFWIVVFVPIAAFYPYLSGLLSIDWRDWMTESFVNRMLRRNALYYIMRDHTVDNPDQRISEDVNSFSNGALSNSMAVLQAIVTTATFFESCGKSRDGWPSVWSVIRWRASGWPC